MDNMKEIFLKELEKYASEGFDSLAFPVFDEKRQHYAIAMIDYPTYKHPADVLILARIVEDKIVIEEDMTDKKLVDALLQQGIPREKIVLVYNGEKAPAPPIPVRLQH